MKFFTKPLLLILLILQPQAVLAQNSNAASGSFGADALLKTVNPQQQGQAAQESEGLVQKQQMLLTGGIKLDDPLVMQLFSEWTMTKNVPYHINLWVQQILKKEYRAAAHLWSKVKSTVPSEFEASARVAYVYLLSKLDVPRTFWDEWMEVLSVPAYRQTRIMSSLHQALYLGFDEWVGKSAIVPTPEQAKLISSLEDIGSPILFSLKARSFLRTGISKETEALRVLEKISPEHPYKAQLAQTVALGFARKGDLSKAATVLKHHLEPAIRALGKPEELSRYYLQIARLLYQAASLDGAEQFYLKIPDGRPEFLTAREEVSWIWLQNGNLTRLRGELKNFRSKVFEDQFMPEVYVVSAVSNLKLCFYDQLENDFRDFLKVNQTWARKIQKQLDIPNPTRPLEGDFFTVLAEKSQSLLQKELSRLQGLGKESITAALPAVGEQSHWTDAQVRVRKAIDSAQKNQSEEYRRQWKNMAWTLREAIRKMKFVKVEMLSQISQLAMQQEQNGGEKAPVAAGSDEITDSRSASVQVQGNDIAFPFDGVLWSDEFFKLRSTVKGKCL